MMDSSKAPFTGQEPMDQAAEEDQIVDLSIIDDEMMDEPPSEGQLVYSPVTEDQEFEQPREDLQVIDQRAVARQVEVPSMKQAELSHEHEVSVLPCPQCGWLVPPNASFCSHCGAQLVSSNSREPLPEYMAVSYANGTSAKRPKKDRKSRWKSLWIGLAAIVAISVMLGLFNQTSGNRTVKTTGTSTPSLTPAATTPTVTARSTLVKRPTSTAGVLILLNPGIVRQGVSMGVTGSGFDPRATIDLLLKQRMSDSGQPIGTGRADKYGNFYDNLTVPQTLSSGPFFIEAHERGSDLVADAAGVVAGGAPQLKLSDQVGKPGDPITVSLHGFSPNETINVYWNTMIGKPFTTLQVDGSGGIGQATVQVPFGAAGVNTFLFVGAKSQSLVAASFDLLSLYPSIKLSSYALRADNQQNFSGTGFGPGERVLVYLNTTAGEPMAVIQTTQKGSFSNAPGFVIPFTLKGKQTLIFLGEESRATVTVSWTVQPYMPNAQASTYGGLPGTTVSFYAAGFARQEVVHVYVGHAQNSAGSMVSCFRTDDKGNAVAAGSYVIPGDAQGKLTFTLIGTKSGGSATATMSITAPPSPVQVPTQPPFTCPLDKGTS